MHSSVTPSAARSGSRSRRVRASAERSWCAAAASLLMGRPRIAQLVDLPEIQIARDQDLDAVALMLGDGWRDADRAAQRLGGDALSMTDGS